MSEPFYITTAISYPNGRPHIGHAYEAIAADSIARFYRLSGRDVRLITGTDEHGLKMVKTARDSGVETIKLADEMSSYFIEMCHKLNIRHDGFRRTTELAHHEASKALWKAMEANGDLYLDRYEGWYSVRDEAFYAEDELEAGEGGEKLSPQGTPVEWTAEATWFFKLSQYQDKLLALYKEHPEFILPESRRNEVMRFVEGGLRDLSVSRTSLDWGVPVPGSPDHVMYVWVDALTTYMTGVGYPDTQGMFAKYWPADLHLIGKDIVRFHAVYWPAFLMSAGLPLPKQVFGHGFLLNRGEKMSKSVGNVVDPMELADRFGVDQLRYFLLADVVFGKDGTYSANAIVTKTNADLANNFGNLAQRSLSMIAKNCDGRIPLPGAKTDAEQQLLNQLEKCFSEVNTAMTGGLFKIDQALDIIRDQLSATNTYFAEQAPWALRKTDPARADSVLYHTAEAVRQLAIMLRWVMPDSCDKMLDLLGQSEHARDFQYLTKPIEPGIAVPEPKGIFPRLELLKSEAEN